MPLGIADASPHENRSTREMPVSDMTSGASADRASTSALAITNRGPLEGLVVLDFTTQKAGPMATYYLAAMGATVIKIEETKGDAVRGYAPFIDRHGELT